MGRFADLSKDVVWLIFKRVIFQELISKYALSGLNNIVFEFPSSPNGYWSFDVMRKYACLSKNMLSLIKSKCYIASTCNGWLLIRGALSS